MAEDIELLEREYHGQMLDFESVSTVTLFCGTPPIDNLQRQVASIVERNPWLGGRLIRRNSGMYVTCNESAECFDVARSPALCLAYEALPPAKHINELCLLFE